MERYTGSTDWKTQHQKRSDGAIVSVKFPPNPSKVFYRHRQAYSKISMGQHRGTVAVRPGKLRTGWGRPCRLRLSLAVRQQQRVERGVGTGRDSRFNRTEQRPTQTCSAEFDRHRVSHWRQHSPSANGAKRTLGRKKPKWKINKMASKL